MRTNNSEFLAGANEAIFKLIEFKQRLDAEPLDHSLEDSFRYSKASSRQFAEGLIQNLNDYDKGMLTGIIDCLAFSMLAGEPDLEVWRPLNALNESEFKAKLGSASNV